MITNLRHFIFFVRSGSILIGFMFLFIAAANAQSPVLASLSPNSVQSGSPGFTLIVNGIDFSSTAVVRWNGIARPSVFVSSTKLTAAISAGDVAVPGTASITVATATGMSDAQTFTISASAVPSISALFPTSVQSGTGNFTLTVTGSGFTGGSIVQWNGSARTTGFFSSGTLEAAISANDVASASIVAITVMTGSAVTNTLTFTIAVNTSPPTISALSPSSAVAKGPGFTLVVTGTNFSATTVVEWNGSARSTTFVNGTTLNAAIPASDIAQPSAASITVKETAPGGRVSNAVNFEVTPVSTLYFPQCAVGGGYTTTFTLTNIRNTTAAGTLSLIDSSGFPLQVNLLDVSVGTQSLGSSFPITVPPGATRVFVANPTNASNPITTGWAQVGISDGTISGVATFRLREGGRLQAVVGVLSSELQGEVTIPVDNDVSQNRYTGFAIANPGNLGIHVTVVILSSEGTILDSISPPALNPLGPRAHAAMFLHELLPARANLRGSMAFVLRGDDQAIVLGLNVEQGMLSAVPVISGISASIP